MTLHSWPNSLQGSLISCNCLPDGNDGSKHQKPGGGGAHLTTRGLDSTAKPYTDRFNTAKSWRQRLHPSPFLLLTLDGRHTAINAVATTG